MNVAIVHIAKTTILRIPEQRATEMEKIQKEISTKIVYIYTFGVCVCVQYS